MMSKIFNKVKFLAICWYKGHLFGINSYHKHGNDLICARCGYIKKRKKRTISEDDFYVY